MPAIGYIIFSCSIIFILIIFFIMQRKKKIYSKLFDEGVKNENNGNYETAMNNYRNAIHEIEKDRSQKKLLQKITQRMKILEMTIDYENGFRRI
jgi:hypothetical protein